MLEIRGKRDRLGSSNSSYEDENSQILKDIKAESPHANPYKEALKEPTFGGKNANKKKQKKVKPVSRKSNDVYGDSSDDEAGLDSGNDTDEESKAPGHISDSLNSSGI